MKKPTMKSLLVSPQSSRTIKPFSMESISPQLKDTNYFPGCRKDANCNCEMCLESITATLDLLPMSAQRSTLTKLWVSKPSVDTTPLSIDSSLLSTPVSKSPPIVASSSSKYSSSCSSSSKMVCKKRKFGVRFMFLKWVLFFGAILGLEFGVSWVLRPELSREIVSDVVKQASVNGSLSERLGFIQEGLNVSVDGKVSSCLLGDSNWKVNKDGLIQLSYCFLYQSVAEEVLIWGWPLQTAGLLTSGFSSRSFYVLSGKIIEWHEGSLISVVRDANTKWVLRKWSSSIVQFEPNTWMIEYRRSSLLQDQRIILLGVKFMKFRIVNFLQKLQQAFWYFNYNSALVSEATGSSTPT